MHQTNQSTSLLREQMVLVNMKTGGDVVSQPTSLLMEQVVFWLEC